MANKNSKTPRDYSKEYNPPGSKEQEERNKRKRDKRKHDKLYGECPEGTELHHTNGIENDEVECVSVSKNRGRKEKSRLKDGEIVIRIKRKDAKVKKLKEGPIFGADDIGVGPSPKQKRSPRNKNLEQAKREFLQALRQTKVGAMDIRDAQEFDKRMMDVLEKAIDNKIKDIAQDYKVFGKKLEEQSGNSNPTVGDFLATWQKQNPSSMQKILGKYAKHIGALVAGAGIGAASGALTGGLGTALGGTAGAAVGAKLGEEAVNRLFSIIAKKSGELAQFMIKMSDSQVPDDQRSGIDLYYDLDDSYEKLLQGMDTPLANAYQKELFKYFNTAFESMEGIDKDEPLENYLEMTANEYLQRWLSSERKSGVGVAVRKTTGTGDR